MSRDSQYLLVSLPTSISPSNNSEDALTTIRSTITTDNGDVLPFKIPHFKIGTLDALVQQADDLGKLEGACESAVGGVGDILKQILEGDDEKITQQKTVNDKPVGQYLRTFQWNKVKYRADKPIGDLIDSLQKELVGINNDVKSKHSQYKSLQTTLATLQRKQTGNLATKSLTSVVRPEDLVRNSEMLESLLIVVPTNEKKAFLNSYETLIPPQATGPGKIVIAAVVPRSARELVQEDELTLYVVNIFKHRSSEFAHKCREHKWTPREYTHVEGGKEEERKELERTQKEERKVWGEVLRLARTGWGEAVMIWIHVLCLRAFVETVLRYGLPLEFVAALVKTTPKLAKKAKQALDSAYSYLGGNALGRDKKGRVTKDDSALSSEMSAAGVSGGGEGKEYTAYVYYEFQVV